ncbi:MAG: carboxypeptidase regulatory-like domain-containing protein [Gemmatimonadaceae bacterium]
MGRPKLSVAALVIHLVIAKSELHAQWLRGVVRDSLSGAPVAGAVVSVIDSSGGVRGRVIVGGDGRFSIGAPPAAASLRVIRIGFRPRDVQLSSSAAARAEPVAISMQRLPALLASIRVSDHSLCDGSDEHGDALTLWEQARAGLLATVITRQTKPARMSVLTFETDEAPDSRLVLKQTTHLRLGTTGRPFLAADQARGFAARGYMDQDSSGRTFHSPDADVILDESFASAHCFRIVWDKQTHPAQVGLSFEPAPERRRDGLVDVSGTIWLDQVVPALRTLEFTFTGLDRGYRDAGAGGTLGFRTMPNGLVYIERWSMVLPALETVLRPNQQSRRSDPSSGLPGGAPQYMRLTGIREVGGVVLSATWPDGSSAAETLGGIDGRVTEAGTGRPMPGVVLRLEGTAIAVASGAQGRFAITRVLPGRYNLRVVDSALAPFVDEHVAARNVEVRNDSTVPLLIELPSRTQALARLCAEDRLAGTSSMDETTVVLGRVLDAGPIRSNDITVRAEWLAKIGTDHRANVTSATEATRVISPGDDGRFFVCGVARDQRLGLHLWRGYTKVADTALFVGDSLAQRLDWAVHLKPTVLAVTNDSTGAFVGFVHADADATALPGAEVAITTLNKSVTTGADGSFRLAALPPGLFGVRVRHVGFAMLQDTIVVRAGKTATRIYELSPRVTMLDTVTTSSVRPRYVSPQLRGFEERSALGIGHFLTEAELRKHDDQSLSTAMRARIPGLLWVSYRSATFLASQRGAGSTFRNLPRALPDDHGSPAGCWVSVYLDGVRIYTPDGNKPAPDFNALDAGQFAGIEFYAGGATVPPQFNATTAFDCGTLLLWTREK